MTLDCRVMSYNDSKLKPQRYPLDIKWLYTPSGFRAPTSEADVNVFQWFGRVELLLNCQNKCFMKWPNRMFSFLVSQVQFRMGGYPYENYIVAGFILAGLQIPPSLMLCSGKNIIDFINNVNIRFHLILAIFITKTVM